MTKLKDKRWYYFDWDEYNEGKVWRHGISPDEAEQCFFNEYLIRPHPKKRYRDRYIINRDYRWGKKVICYFSGPRT